MHAPGPALARIVLLLAGSGMLSIAGCNDLLDIHEPSQAVLDLGGDAGPSPSEPLSPPREQPDADADGDQDAGR